MLVLELSQPKDLLFHESDSNKYDPISIGVIEFESNFFRSNRIEFIPLTGLV